jgi:hypothetical protein
MNEFALFGKKAPNKGNLQVTKKVILPIWD